MMYHPMHLHGHTFQVIKPDGSMGARKDTVNVLPKQKSRRCWSLITLAPG